MATPAIPASVAPAPAIPDMPESAAGRSSMTIMATPTIAWCGSSRCVASFGAQPQCVTRPRNRAVIARAQLKVAYPVSAANRHRLAATGGRGRPGTSSAAMPNPIAAWASSASRTPFANAPVAAEAAEARASSSRAAARAPRPRSTSAKNQSNRDESVSMPPNPP